MGKKFNSFKAAVSRGYLRAGAMVGTALVAVPAMAQVTDPFETALSTSTTKVETYAAALVTVAAISTVFMIAIKYVKKIPRAA